MYHKVLVGINELRHEKRIKQVTLCHILAVVIATGLAQFSHLAKVGYALNNTAPR